MRPGRWRTPARAARRPPDAPRSDHVAAARRLRVRTRRQVTDLFAGHYVSAFRGPGIEYAESRPYVPGDDVRSFDWNATARTGVPHVKQHRPERGRTLLVVIDASPTMHFATGERSKLEAACDAAALLATAALAVGDRVGLLLHDGARATVLPARRGELQLHRLLEVLAAPDRLASSDPAARPVDLAGMLETRRRHGDLIFHFSDVRDASLAAPAAAGPPSIGAARTRAGGETVLVLCSDPGELAWPEAGPARVTPAPGAGEPAAGSLVFDGDDAFARRRFEREAARRVAAVAHRTRARGDDFVHLRSDRDPLRLWLGFFRSRAGGSVGG